MMPAVLAASAALIGLVILGAIEMSEHGGAPAPEVVRLRFGRDVTTEAVVALLDALAGLAAGATVGIEVRADHQGIEHFLRAQPAAIDNLRVSLRALIPSVRLEPAKREDSSTFRYGRTIAVRGRFRVLRNDLIEETSAGLLACLYPLGRDERLLIRWLIRPGRPEAIPEQAGNSRLRADARHWLRLKNQGGVLRTRGLIAVSSEYPGHAGHLMSRLIAVLRSRATPYGHTRTYSRGGWWLRRELNRRRFLIGDRLGSKELAGLLAWPIEAPTLPGLSLGTAPLLMPSGRLPRFGRLVGNATWPGDERPVYQPVVGALSHSLIAGPTGTGKSTFLTNLIGADIASGRGVVLIDGKGDTASAVLSCIPPERAGDVVVLDCASDGAQPGIKLFDGHDAELAADVALGVLSELFRDSWGPLSERYLRAGLSAVAHDDEGTLADVPYVFSDAAYRRRLAPRVADPLTRATLAALDAMSPAERSQQLAAPMNRLSTLLSRPVVRTVLGQSSSRLDFSEVLRRRRIVVVSLAPARVGSSAAQLIGALSLYALFRAVQGRSRLPERLRSPFFTYLDEPKALGALPMPLDLLLEQARGLGCGVVISPQSVSQLPAEVQRAVLTNAATRIAFRQEADDARLLARDLPGVSPEELGDLGQYEVVARIGLGPGDVAPPVTLRTLPPGKQLSDPQRLSETSAADYGLGLAQVDEQLAARHNVDERAPVGRVSRRKA